MREKYHAKASLVANMLLLNECGVKISQSNIPSGGNYLTRGSKPIQSTFEHTVVVRTHQHVCLSCSEESRAVTKSVFRVVAGRLI